MPRLLAACAGFLLGVLWMDLMFDDQVWRVAGPLPDAALTSIAAYYRRVTTDASPMGSLIAAVMLTAVGGALVTAVRTRSRRALASVVVIAIPVGLALGRIVPNAVRLGQRTDPLAVQIDLAHAIALEHVLCFVAVVVFLALQLARPRSDSDT